MKILSLFLENSFANVLNSSLYVRKWKHFWRLYPKFENKKSTKENSFAMLELYFVVTQLRVLILSSDFAFNWKTLHLKIK